jgi:hypothetical protein
VEAEDEGFPVKPGDVVFLKGWRWAKETGSQNDDEWEIARVREAISDDGETQGDVLYSEENRYFRGGLGGPIRILDKNGEPFWDVIEVITEEEIEKYRVLGDM